MKRQPNNNGGFSLLEVILAMAILAIISIPLLSYFTQSMKYNAMMADKQHATNLAQEVLEDLKTKRAGCGDDRGRISCSLSGRKGLHPAQ